MSGYWDGFSMTLQNGSGAWQSWRDDIADRLAAYAIGLDTEGRREHDAGAKRILLDTLAVGLGAYRHRAAAIARQYVSFFPPHPAGATIWGTRARAPMPVAALANGALLRCYDYNDFMVGKYSPGHPSDMLSPLLAVAEWRGSSGRELLDALAIGYEIASAIYDVSPSEDSGWDHANLSALGATGAIARLLGLTVEQATEAFGIVAIQHIQSNEIESSAPNKRGDLTMWKRFHGADIMRYALEACLLASKGAEGPVRPFRGDLGFLKIFRAPEDPAPILAERLRGGRPMTAVDRTNFKRWPVGSRGQSAIQATIDARRQMPAGTSIDRIEVRTEPGVFHHLVTIRNDPWCPVSREAADHSLPYIVGTAALDGFVKVASFDQDKVLDPDRAAFVAERVRISVDETLVRNDTALNLSEVEIVTTAGDRFIGKARPAPGHQLNPLTDTDLAEKLHESADGILPTEQLNRLIAAVSGIGNMGDVQTLTALLVGENEL